MEVMGDAKEDLRRPWLLCDFRNLNVVTEEGKS
jgi:hypothetical protein